MLKPKFVILFLIVCIPSTFCLFHDTIRADGLLGRVVKRLNKIEGTNITGETYPQAVELVHKFLGEFKELNSYIVSMPRFTQLRFDYGQRLTKQIKKQIEITAAITIASNRFDKFIKFVENPPALNLSRKEFAEKIMQDVDITYRTIPLRGISLWGDGLFELIAHSLTNETNNECGDAQKLQSFFIGIYKRVVLAEIKTRLISAWVHVYSDGTEGARLNEIEFSSDKNKRLLEHSYALLNALEALNASYFRYCYPDYNPWIRGISYLELNGFIQEVIFEYESLTCSSSCWNIWNKKLCSPQWFDDRTSCHGQITSCRELGGLEACTSKQGHRKYEWVDTSEYGVQGRNHASCPANVGDRIQTTTWSFSPTSSCHCHCLEKKWTVYLGLLESDTKYNYVVTGARFMLKNNMLFLQPAQGRLNDNGYIDVFAWIPLPDVVSENDTGRLDLNHRSFFFDDLQLGPTHVLTGIKLDAVERARDTKIKGFAISIAGRPLNYRTGRLDMRPENKKVIRAPRSRIEKELIYQRVRPLDTEIFEHQEPSSGEFTYATLQQSELSDDFGQSTLPLFDNTIVVMERQSPLSGIGIFHKGSKHNAGFISIRIRSINYSPYVKKLIDLYVANTVEVND